MQEIEEIIRTAIKLILNNDKLTMIDPIVYILGFFLSDIAFIAEHGISNFTFLTLDLFSMVVIFLLLFCYRRKEFILTKVFLSGLMILTLCGLIQRFSYALITIQISEVVYCLLMLVGYSVLFINHLRKTSGEVEKEQLDEINENIVIVFMQVAFFYNLVALLIFKKSFLEGFGSFLSNAAILSFITLFEAKLN